MDAMAWTFSSRTIREPLDVVLVDWNMPSVTGLEFVQLVRRNPEYDRLKLMMVTINNTGEKVIQALEAGANDFLMKPVTKEALEEKASPPRVDAVIPSDLHPF